MSRGQRLLAWFVAVTIQFMAVDVSTPVYEGPFDLLLHLILKEQVEKGEIKIAGAMHDLASGKVTWL